MISGEVKAADLSNTYVNTLSTGPNDEMLSLQVEVDGTVEFNGIMIKDTSGQDTQISRPINFKKYIRLFIFIVGRSKDHQAR